MNCYSSGTRHKYRETRKYGVMSIFVSYLNILIMGYKKVCICDFYWVWTNPNDCDPYD